MKPAESAVHGESSPEECESTQTTTWASTWKGAEQIYAFRAVSASLRLGQATSCGVDDFQSILSAQALYEVDRTLSLQR